MKDDVNSPADEGVVESDKMFSSTIHQHVTAKTNFTKHDFLEIVNVFFDRIEGLMKTSRNARQ